MNIKISDSHRIFIVFTNSDLTEGRGYPVFVDAFFSETSAKRAAKGIGVQGTDGTIEESIAIYINEQWFIPYNIKKPSINDVAKDKRKEEIKEVLDKIKSLGLTSKEMELLKEIKI